MDKLQEIREKLGRGEILVQLAEEASELSKAALKLRRASGETENKTPVEYAEAFENLVEEFADLRVCFFALGLDTVKVACDINEIATKKIDRWHWRLFGGGGNG